MEGNQKFSLILERLLERTKEGKLEWKSTADKNTFLVVLKDSSISIQGNEAYGLGIYEFSFRNEDGEIIQSVRIFHSDEEFEKAQSLFNSIRRHALNIDQTLDHILEQLAV